MNLDHAESLAQHPFSATSADTGGNHGRRFFEVLRDGEMDRTLDGDGRRLFERFVEIEEGHQAIVQAEIDSVSGTGVWFDMKEFNLEMG